MRHRRAGPGGIRSSDQAETVIQKQLALLKHRGPDDSRYVVDTHFAFGHTRLAIIDPEHGQQPLVSDDGNLIITFNGEIYNYLELRDELMREGVAFRTASDTEVLLNGFRQWQKNVLHKIDGMFAFAIYDKRRREVFCARDPMARSRSTTT